METKGCRGLVINLGEIYWLATNESRGKVIDIVEGPFTSYLAAITRQLELTETGQNNLRIMSARVEAECAEVIGQSIWKRKDNGLWDVEDFKRPKSVEEGQERLKTENPEDQGNAQMFWDLLQPKIKELKEES